MSRYLTPAALLLALLALPAQAGTANASMQVGFVLTEACTVNAQAGAPSVSCSHDSPYRLGRVDAAAQQGTQAGSAAWTVYF